MLTVREEGGSTKVKMLTVVDGRRVGRVKSKKVKLLVLKLVGEGGLKKTKLLTVVDAREGGMVKILKKFSLNLVVNMVFF